MNCNLAERYGLLSQPVRPLRQERPLQLAAQGSARPAAGDNTAQAGPLLLVLDSTVSAVIRGRQAASQARQHWHVPCLVGYFPCGFHFGTQVRFSYGVPGGGIQSRVPHWLGWWRRGRGRKPRIGGRGARPKPIWCRPRQRN